MKHLIEPNTELLFSRLANIFSSSLKSELKNGGVVRIALSGGQSITGFLSELVRIPISESESPFDKAQIQVFLADERVTSDTAKLNSTLLEKHLIGRNATKGFTSRFFPNITHDITTNERIDDYNAEFRNAVCFDFVILGVGEDGHCASIFPTDYTALNSGKYYVRIGNSPKPPKNRITLSKKAILEAHKIVLLFIGPDKKKALVNFLDPSKTVDQCPCKLALESEEKLIVATNIV